MKDAINARVILLLTLVFLGMTLYGRWQEEHAPVSVNEPKQQSTTPTTHEPDVPTDIPFSDAPTQTTAAPVETVQVDRLISVENNVLKLKIDKKGGDIVYAELKDYPKVKGKPEQGFVLLDKSKERFYIAQTGLIAKSGPDSRTLGRAEYTSQFSHYDISS
ncbi:MAG TPA: membrane protein insertase YidC, partial [Gammaproteobacteria bacterium]|nr:membrane protein insertase YidC [Gammaproteobacteria bacterium]